MTDDVRSFDPSAEVIREVQAQFKKSEEWYKSWEAVRLRYVLMTAGDQWGVRVTPEQIMSALDAAGFEIVAKQPPVDDDD